MKFATGDLIVCPSDERQPGEFELCSYGPRHWSDDVTNKLNSQPELRSLRHTSPRTCQYHFHDGKIGIITRTLPPEGPDSKGVYEVLLDGVKYLAQDYVLHRHMNKL